VGWRGYFDLKRRLHNRSFDAVLAMQVSLRANLICACLRSKRKIGFDKLRAKDLHGGFIHERIPFKRVHVLDGFFQFLEHLGITQKQLDWSIPVSETDREFAREHLPNGPILAISPCSSHPLRNWLPEHYAQVALHAHTRYGFQVVLLGGRSTTEHDMGQQIIRHLDFNTINLIGKDTLKKLLAILEKSTILLTPDSGPAHMATCTDTPVIGLYAASNPFRSGPYNSIPWCVNAYPEASLKYYSKDSDTLRWGQKIEFPGVMELINPQAVIDKLDLLADHLGIAKII
jgi:heptosyltransferase I